jgi:hypothetical protein
MRENFAFYRENKRIIQAGILRLFLLPRQCADLRVTLEKMSRLVFNTDLRFS